MYQFINDTPTTYELSCVLAYKTVKHYHFCAHCFTEWVPRVGPGCRIDPIRFLAGWRITATDTVYSYAIHMLCCVIHAVDIFIITYIDYYASVA